MANSRLKSSRLSLTPIEEIPLIHEGDGLEAIIAKGLENVGLSLLDGDILVLTSKIISKAEGRQTKLSQIMPSESAFELAQITGKDPRLVELILQESNEVVRAQTGVLIVEHRLGFVSANAGIDHSNVEAQDDLDGEVLLLPVNPDKSAEKIRSFFEEKMGVSIGVLIIDSHGRPWRLGTVGTAIGISGLPGLVDLRGKPDLFGIELKITQVAVADELAAAASLIMGQADEGRPIVHVRGFPYNLRDASFSELLRPRGMDLFR